MAKRKKLEDLLDKADKNSLMDAMSELDKWDAVTSEIWLPKSMFPNKKNLKTGSKIGTLWYSDVYAMDHEYLQDGMAILISDFETRPYGILKNPPVTKKKLPPMDMLFYDLRKRDGESYYGHRMRNRDFEDEVKRLRKRMESFENMSMWEIFKSRINRKWNDWIYKKSRKGYL